MDLKDRVTINDVANEAGVSKQTVSRVLNDRPDVASETRQRIQEVINRLDYRPSAVARSLINRRSFTLGVVTAGLKYIGPSQTLNGIADKAEELGYALLLVELPSFDTMEVDPVLDGLLARQVDGIIWAVQEVGENRKCLQDRLPNLGVPIIFIARGSQESLSTVSVDNYKGAKDVTRHLIDQGCQNIGHIAGPQEWWEARRRKAGWEDALSEAGVQVTDSHWVAGNWSSRSGSEAFAALLEKYPAMDGVFAANDQMALSVLQVAHQRGIQVPGDLSVVGFDGIPEADYFWPALTTVNQSLHTLGRTAVREIVSMIDARWNKKRFKPESILLQPELIIRESSCRHTLEKLKKQEQTSS